MSYNKRIFKKLKSLISEKLHIDESTLSCNTKLEELGVDSLTLMELTMDIEDLFNITIPDHISRSFRYVKDIVDFISHCDFATS